VAAARVQADRQEARDQPRVARHHAQVGGEHEVEARPDRSAPHRGDRRRLEHADARERAVDGAETGVDPGVGRVAAGGVERRAVAARAEEAALAAHDHRAHVMVGVELVAGGHQLVGHVDGDRVAPAGGVQREDRHAAVAALDRDLVGHDEAGRYRAPMATGPGDWPSERWRLTAPES
jgi:hypothetical protein